MIEGALAMIDVAATLLGLVRLAAAVGGALLGWFVTGPVARLLYRAAFRRPVPGWLLPWARLGGAALAGWLFFCFLPLGGSGGFGWGPGAGGGAGLGPGDGSGNTTLADKAAPADEAASKKVLLEIELSGGTRYRGDGRYYLIHRREPAVTLEEVEDYFKKNEGSLAEYVIIVLTPNQSVDELHPAVLRLKTIIEKYQRKPQVKDVGA
jgi:hypothetical protein